MLTVACVYVRGPFPYTAEYVVRLERMVRQRLDRAFRFVCLTDRPDEVPSEIEAIRVPSFAGRVPDNGVGYWAKVRLFDRSLGLRGRVLFLDLDTLVTADLAPIVDVPASLALTADALVEERRHLTTDRYGRALVRRFNSSVMVWDAGAHDALWDDWSPDVAQRLSTDQDWIGEQAPSAVGMPLAWFPRISQVSPPWPAEAKVILVKKPKNHICAERWPWFDRLWGGVAA